MRARIIVMLVLASMTSLCSGLENDPDDLRHAPLDFNDNEAVIAYVSKVAFNDPEARRARRDKRELNEDLGEQAEVGSEDLQETITDDSFDTELAEKALENTETAIEEATDLVQKALETSNGDPPKEIKVDITSGQGEIDGKDMELPPVKMSVLIEDEEEQLPPNSGMAGPGFAPFTIGLGGALMNGCYRVGYVRGDPCWTWVNINKCADLLEACSYIGVGFDATGVFGPESRKGNVLGYTCRERRYYLDGEGNRKDVPDMMRISGEYGVNADTKYYESAAAYQKTLEIIAGISGTSGAFSASIAAAYGEKKKSKTQGYLAVFTVDVRRYEVYINKFTAEMLDTNFMKEFIDLPLSYYEEGAARKYQDFIIRWGTHHVISAEFGGKLEIRQSMQSSSVSSLQKFSVEARAAFKLFWSMSGHFGANGSFANSEASKNMSTSIQVEGGSPMIAEAIANSGSTDIRANLDEWLRSLHEFPKPYNFRLSRLTELFTFTSAEYFPADAGENANWGCASDSLETDENGSFVLLNLEKTNETTNEVYIETVKKYCHIKSRDELTTGINKRRDALETAITTYMLQGPVSFGQDSLAGQEDCYSKLSAASQSVSVPNWTSMMHDKFRIRLAFPDDISSRLGEVENDGQLIVGFNPKIRQWWYKDLETNALQHGLSTYTSDQMLRGKVMGVAGLFFHYDEEEGYFSMDESDYQISLVQYPDLPPHWMDGRPLAYAEALSQFHSYPCTYRFSNAQRLEEDAAHTTCIRFLAASEGPIYLIAAVNPERKSTWYTTMISPDGVAFYKGNEMIKHDTSVYVSGLGSRTVLQTYFVCIKKVVIPGASYLILEYGKAATATDSGVVYLMMADRSSHFPTYYAFGAGEKTVTVSDAKRTQRNHLANSIAVHKPTYQSSTSLDRVPARAVDGNHDRNLSSGSCTHTESDQNAWWLVDLEDHYLVSSVRITNRVDFSERLTNFDILLCDTTLEDAMANLNMKSCTYNPGGVGTGSPIFACTAPTTARYVKIRLRGTGFLTLCEVDVYEQSASNIAWQKSSYQSSTYEGGGASSRAVDGNRDPTFTSNSCTHTDPEDNQNAWWLVDLGKDYLVSSVRITNRADCCQSRLSNFDIFLGDTTLEDAMANLNMISCTYRSGTVPTGSPMFICTAPTTARYVKIRLRAAASILTLCEVEVYEPFAPLTSLECGPHLVEDHNNKFCVDANCHDECQSIGGCSRAVNGDPQPDDCVGCKNLVDYIGDKRTCVSSCRENFVETDGICKISCPADMEEKAGICVCLLQEGSQCVANCSAGLLPKLNTGEGAIYNCDCSIKHGENCVDDCPPLTAKSPDEVPGFFNCEDPKGVQILTGKRVPLGAIPQPDVTSIQECYSRCREFSQILDPTSCGGYEWDARDGGSCSIHSEVTACGNQVDDSEVTLVRMVICVAPSTNVFGSILPYHSIPSRGRWISEAVLVGSDMSYDDCADYCQPLSGDGCTGLSYNEETSQCWITQDLCPTQYKYDTRWVSLVSVRCVVAATAYPESATCRYTYKGTEYVGSKNWTPDWECYHEPKICTNSEGTQKMPFCDSFFVKFCAIPMCAPYGYDVIEGYCEQFNTVITNLEYDAGAWFHECAIACTARSDCLSFIWFQNDSEDVDDHDCILLSSLNCGDGITPADIKTDGWGFQYTKTEPSYLPPAL